MSESDEVPEPALPLTGGCCCERVRFEVSAPLLGAAACYCKRCQRRTGTGFSVTALTLPGSFRITAGEELVRAYAPDDGWRKSFCSACGGHLFTSNPENEELIAVRMGAIDGEPGVRVGAHQFTRYAAPWAPPPDDGLPHFPERLGWSQVDTGA